MVNKLDLYDIYGMWYIPFWQTKLFWVIISIILLLFFVVFMGIVIKKWRAKKQKVTPWDEALCSLNAIKDIVNSSQGKQFYFSLTIILKRYLSNRYGFDVYGKTDEELLCYLASNHFPAELLLLVESVFSGGVYIKFANAQALREQLERDYSNSFQIVKQTIPKIK